MKLKLIQVEDEVFKLCDENNEEIVSFDVEINKETALISYETKENYRHQGYASIGLSLLRDTLFSDENILFLELIHLSGDYSRKVAENAGFFSRSHNLDYYVCLSPYAEQVVNDRLSSLDTSSIEYKKNQRLLEKVQNLRLSENRAKEALKEHLDELLQTRELLNAEPEESDNYKNYVEYVESEIKHLEKIMAGSQDIEKKI